MLAAYGIMRLEKCDEQNIEQNNRFVMFYDELNHFALEHGFNDIVELFAQLSKQKTDSEIESCVVFLGEIRRVRNDIAHAKALYKIEQSVFKELDTCAKICGMNEE